MSEYQTVVLSKRPGFGPIIPGETFALKSATRVDESQLKDGQFEIQNLYLSLDPAMRGWLNGASHVMQQIDVKCLLTAIDARSYVPPVKIGEIMRGATVGKVTKTKSSKFPKGAYVFAQPAGWTEFTVLDEETPGVDVVEVPEGGKTTDALGVLGLTGLTAYFGILEVGQVKAGDFVVVSGAAGATGSVVCQIAKLKGATVLGLAGSDDKVEWLRELGCDDAINYKDKDFAKKFREKTPVGRLSLWKASEC